MYFQGYIDMSDEVAAKFGLTPKDKFPNGLFGSMERNIEDVGGNKDVLLFSYLGEKFKMTFGDDETPKKIEMAD